MPGNFSAGRHTQGWMDKNLKYGELVCVGPDESVVQTICRLANAIEDPVIVSNRNASWMFKHTFTGQREVWIESLVVRYLVIGDTFLPYCKLEPHFGKATKRAISDSSRPGKRNRYFGNSAS